MSLDYYSAIFHIVASLLIIGSISPIPQEGPIPVVRTIDFTWEPSLWFKNYDERAAIITGAAIAAYKKYDNYYNLFEGRILLDLSIKAVKKSCFEHGFGICMNYVTPRWGGEISITIVDKPVEKPIEKPVQKLTEEVPRIRQIMVCKNV
jgi:hypothetical protein